MTLVLKAVHSEDEMHVDEQGRHLIFRTINGRVVPMRVTAEDYTEWLVGQGIPVDPADQRLLRMNDDMLYQIAEIGETNPTAAMAMEKQWREQLTDYIQRVQGYYQQALAKQSQESGVSPEELKASRDKKLQDYMAEQSQGQEAQPEKTDMAKYVELQRRDRIEDRGWNNFVGSLVGEIVNHNNIEENSPKWYLMQAFDLMLRNGIERAQNGQSKHDTTLAGLVAKELQDFEGYGKNQDYYAELVGEEGRPYLGYHLPNGIRDLKANLESGNSGAKYLEDLFTSVYSKMFDEFNRGVSSTESLEDIAPRDKSMASMVPESLPERYSGKERDALLSWYKESSKKEGRQHSSAVAAAKHAIVRAFESLPEHERSKVLHGGRGSIEEMHRTGAEEGAKLGERGIPVNATRTLSELLSIAQEASNSGELVQDRVSNIKHMAYLMGKLDGANIHLAREAMLPGRGRSSFDKLYESTFRQTGLIDTLADENSRKNALFDNRKELFIHHTPSPATGGQDTVEIPKEVQKPTEDIGARIKEFRRDGEAGRFTHNSGNYLVPDNNGREWGVYTADGTQVGKFTNLTGNIRDALSRGLQEIDSLGEVESVEQAEPEVESPPASNEQQGSLFDALDRLPKEPVEEATEPVSEPEAAPVVEEAPKPKKERQKKARVPSPTVGSFGRSFPFASKLTTEENKKLEPIVQAITDAGLDIKDVVSGKASKVSFDGGELFVSMDKNRKLALLVKKDGKNTTITPSDAVDLIRGQKVEEPAVEEVPVPEETAVTQEETVQEEIVEEAPEETSTPDEEVTSLHPDFEVSSLSEDGKRKYNSIAQHATAAGYEVVGATNRMMKLKPKGSTNKDAVDAVMVSIGKNGEVMAIPQNSKRAVQNPDYGNEETLAKIFGAKQETPTEIPVAEPEVQSQEETTPITEEAATEVAEEPKTEAPKPAKRVAMQSKINPKDLGTEGKAAFHNLTRASQTVGGLHVTEESGDGYDFVVAAARSPMKSRLGVSVKDGNLSFVPIGVDAKATFDKHGEKMADKIPTYDWFRGLLGVGPMASFSTETAENMKRYQETKEELDKMDEAESDDDVADVEDSARIEKDRLEQANAAEDAQRDENSAPESGRVRKSFINYVRGIFSNDR